MTVGVVQVVIDRLSDHELGVYKQPVVTVVAQDKDGRTVIQTFFIPHTALTEIQIKRAAQSAANVVEKRLQGESQ